MADQQPTSGRLESNAPTSAPVATPAFQLGETVYSAISPDTRGMVTGLIYRPGVIQYYVTWSESHEEELHYALELSTEPLGFQPTR